VTPAGTVGSGETPLAQRYDVALLDLDGVVYVGSHGVPGAADALAQARAAGMRLAFVTNNAFRTPEDIATHLRELGIEAAAEEVVTSAQAAARTLAEQLPAGARVLVVGGKGPRSAVLAAGLAVVSSADDEPVAVVQGYAPDTGWRELAEAAVAIQHGALWLATNLDATLPSARGPLPGNGAMVAALRVATGVEPLATGKPDPAMHRESVLRSGAREPIVVGDRLDTDIQGAARVGCDSLLVLTGVARPAELLAAPPGCRPTYVAAGLDGLLARHPAPRAVDGGWACRGWVAAGAADGCLVLSGPDDATAATGASADDLDALRALCAAAWSTDPSRRTECGGRFRASDARAAAVLGRLGLADAPGASSGAAR
jgi:glycerol-1-phosphatase